MNPPSSKPSKPKAKSGRKQNRRNNASAIPRSLSNIDKVHTFTRSASLTVLNNTAGFVPSVGSALGQPLFSMVFTTQDFFLYFNSARTTYSTVAIPGISDLAALFDEVQLDAVELTICSNNQPEAGAGSGSSRIMICTDYNDGNPPTSLGDVQQYADCKLVHLQPYSDYTEIIRPKFLTYTLDSGGTQVASTPSRGFVRSNLQIDHYGKKGAFVNFSPSSSTTCVFLVKYKYNCRIVK